MKYFVLKPAGDDAYAKASRAAMLAFADVYVAENPQMAREVADWANQETAAAEPMPGPTRMTFDQAVEFGKKFCKSHSHELVNGIPWHFIYKGHSFTHENDDLYFVGFSSMEFRRGDVLVATFTDSGTQLAVEKGTES